MMQKISFQIRGDDVSGDVLVSTIQGIAKTLGDKTLQVYRTMIVVAQTDDPELARVLTVLSKANGYGKAPKAPAVVTVKEKALAADLAAAYTAKKPKAKRKYTKRAPAVGAQEDAA